MNDTTSSNNAVDKQESFITRFIAATEIDPRLLNAWCTSTNMVWISFLWSNI